MYISYKDGIYPHNDGECFKPVPDQIVWTFLLGKAVLPFGITGKCIKVKLSLCN